MQLTPEMIADIVINIVNIIVLFVIVRALAYKPVKKFMDARAARVEAVKTDAEQMAQQAQAKIKECDAVLADSAAAKQSVLDEAEKLAREQSERLINEANTRAKGIVDEAERKAEAEHAKMLENARDEVASLAVEVSSKLLAREITDEDNREIVKAFLSETNG